MPEDRSWVAFELRPEARWHDGQPVTVEDVIFSLEHPEDQGRTRSTAPTTPTWSRRWPTAERG